MTHEELKSRLAEIASALVVGRSEADRTSEAVLALLPLIESLSERLPEPPLYQPTLKLPA